MKRTLSDVLTDKCEHTTGIDGNSDQMIVACLTKDGMAGRGEKCLDSTKPISRPGKVNCTTKACCSKREVSGTRSKELVFVFLPACNSVPASQQCKMSLPHPRFSSKTPHFISRAISLKNNKAEIMATKDKTNDTAAMPTRTSGL